MTYFHLTLTEIPLHKVFSLWADVVHCVVTNYPAHNIQDPETTYHGPEHPTALRANVIVDGRQVGTIHITGNSEPFKKNKLSR